MSSSHKDKKSKGENSRHVWTCNTNLGKRKQIELELDICAPVNRIILPTSPPSLTSLGMKFSKLVDIHNVGCRSSSKSITASSPSTKIGLHAGSPKAPDDFAKLNKQSSSAKTRIARSHKARSESNSAYMRNLKAFIAAVRFSWASFNCLIRFWREPTTNRFLALVPELFVQSLGSFFLSTVAATSTR